MTYLLAMLTLTLLLPMVTGAPVQAAETNLPRWIPLNLIVPPSDPINGLDQQQVLQLRDAYLRGDPVPPITVFALDDGRYEVVFGQHRLAAAELARMDALQAYVLPRRPSTLEILALQYKENSNHRSLNALERANAFFKAKAAGALSNKKVAELYDVSEATVSRDLRTSENLHPALKDLYAAFKLCPKKAWASARLPVDQQVTFHEKHQHESAEDYCDSVAEYLDSGRKPKKPKLVTLKFKGATATVPEDLDAADVALTAMLNAIRKCKKEGFGMQSVPQLLRHPPMN